MDKRIKRAMSVGSRQVRTDAADSPDAERMVSTRLRPAARPAVALASMILLSASLSAGACLPTAAWAADPSDSVRTTGDVDAGSRPGEGGQGTGSGQDGPSGGGDAGSQPGGDGSGSADPDGDAGSGSTGGADEPDSPDPAPSQPTQTVHKIYLNWGPLQGYVVGSVDAPDGGVAQEVDGHAVEGYKFDGWAYDAACTVPFDWNAPVYSDQSVWACYEKVEPEYSVSDLDGVMVDVDGVRQAISPGTTTTVGHDARVSLYGVPDGWTVTKTTGADGVEEITVTSPDGKTTATWSFRREPAVDSADNRDAGKSGVERDKADAERKGSHAGEKKPTTPDSRRTDGGGLLSPKAGVLAVMAVVGASVVAACLARLCRLDAMAPGSEAGDSAGDAAPRGSGEPPKTAVYASAEGDGDWHSAGTQAPTQLMRSASMPIIVDSGCETGLADLVRRTTEGVEPEAAGHGGVGLDAQTGSSTVVIPQETLVASPQDTLVISPQETLDHRQ